MPKPPSPFVESLLDLLAPMGEIVAKRMFGGYGIYKEGLMFGLVAWDRFYLKVDGETKEHFETHACEPFVYEMKNGRSTSMVYYEPPESAFSSAIKMKPWAMLGWQAAQRKAAATSPKKRKK
jgi:DNA transformation protein and related proteins